MEIPVLQQQDVQITGGPIPLFKQGFNNHMITQGTAHWDMLEVYKIQVYIKQSTQGNVKGKKHRHFQTKDPHIQAQQSTRECQQETGSMHSCYCSVQMKRQVHVNNQFGLGS